MAGGKATPKKDKEVKMSSGMTVKTGQILVRGKPTYKAGINAGGQGIIFALSSGKAYFTKKKTSHGRVRTFVNVMPEKEKAAK